MRPGARAGAILLILATSPTLPPRAAPGPRSVAAWSHDLDVTLDPAAHRMQATDRITVVGEGGPLRFSLHAGLKISGLKIDGKDARSSLSPDDADQELHKSHLVSYKGPPLSTGAQLQLTYEGVIHDPVSSEKSLGFVAGDATTGIIGEEGVFLDGGTGWVPIIATPGGELAMYNVTSRVPEPWRVVTQGRRQPSKSTRGVSVTRYVAEVPSDGLALVAGRYAVKSIEHGGVVISTYFFEEEAAQADLFLTRTAEYLDRFSTLLTPYPYSRFDIVENFFTTGYGFPSFTLLGQDVVKMGEMALRPGYVDHEVMHCWWGNYVYPDAATGNWSEGLTTYFANYLAQEQAGPREASDYRRNIAQKYSLRVKPDLDYPLDRFTEKKRDFENEIGYGKAAMVFHMLRRMSGDDIFFRTMREMAVNFGGRRAGWPDFRAAFEAATGRDLSGFFAEWVGRAGLPVLTLGQTRSERGPSAGSYIVSGTVEQDVGTQGGVYHVPLPLVVVTTRGSREYLVDLKERVTTFSLQTDALALDVRIDPDMHVPRRLRAPEAPPCLNAALEDGKKMIVLPSGAEDAYARLAETASSAKGAVIAQGGDPGGPSSDGSSILFFGPPDRNAAERDLLARIGAPVKVSATGFTVAGETFDGPDYSLLYCSRHPDDPNHVVAFFFGMSPESLARSRNLFYYGWDSWVVFKAGRPERRGTLEINGPSTRKLLVRDITTGAGGITGDALMGHARALTSAAMEGRRAGTPGHDAAASYIEKFFGGSGVAPGSAITSFIEGYRHAFSMPLVDVDPDAPAAAEVLVKRPGGDSRYAALPFPIAPGAAPSDPAMESGEVVFLDPEDLASMAGAQAPHRIEGGTVMTVERPFVRDASATARGRPEIDPSAASLLVDEVRGAAALGASTLIIVRGPGGATAYQPLLSFPSSPSPADKESLEARRKSGEFPGADIYFSGRASRLPFPGAPPELLVLSVGPELGADLLGRHSFERHAAAPLEAPQPGYRPIDLDLEVSASAPLRVERRPMVNVVGYLEGSDPSLKSEAVVLVAHYDGMGRSEDGLVLPGASDNAAGVAALLEISRWLSDPARRPARSVVLVATDGEEWGLAGSRALAGRVSEMTVRPVAVVNIDSIGSPDVAAPYLIGASHNPEIRATVEELGACLGVGLGRDIDPYAFEYGSDYYPFHLTGVPAVGFFAANYRALHRSTDTFESLDAAALERVTRLAALTVWALAM